MSERESVPPGDFETGQTIKDYYQQYEDAGKYPDLFLT